jgi:hypothetical protein
MVNKEDKLLAKHCYFDRGFFEKGFGQGRLRETVGTSSKDCKCLFKFFINIIALIPSSMCLHVLVYACFNLS